MYCNKCGKEIESGRFCMDCATEIAKYLDENQLADIVMSSPSTEPVSNPAPEAQPTIAPTPEAEPIIASTPEAQPTIAPAPETQSESYAAPTYSQPIFTEAAVNHTKKVEIDPTLPEYQNRMYGFGKALCSAIVGVVGYIVSYVGFLLTMISMDSSMGVTFGLICLPCAIISAILGISSIRLFKKRRLAAKKPIPALILGIVGVVCAAVILIFVLDLFMISGAAESVSDYNGIYF